LREAVVDAAGVGAGLWLSYLFLFFYLFIAAAAVTHRDFLFESPVKLPFLGVELPLLGFFVLGPLLFLVLHAYVLLHFAMFADKVGVFHSELQAQINDESTRTRLRRQLPSNIFVQYLAGPYEVRTGVMGFMLRLIALITLVIFPIALLVLFELQFLPYHNAPITWWLRVAVLLDILLLWTLWPSIARGQTSWISWQDFRRPRTIAFLFASFVPLSLVFTIATFPGEWLDSKLPSLPLVPTYLLSPRNDQTQPQLEERRRWTSLHDLLVAGDVDLIARKPTSLWSNRLVLPGIDVIDHAKFDSEEKIAASRETLSLRGRHLERAVLIGSDLRKTDLTAARLQGAVLVRADLRKAKFCEPEMKGEKELHQDCAQLEGAILIGTDLRGAILQQVNLQGADLRAAELQGADLRSGNLQGADLSLARLRVAHLSSAKLQGAILIWTQLQGADLSGAQFQGATLRSAELQGANLVGAELQGASLEQAKLQGANLFSANLQGADLTGSQVWQASFSGLKPPVLGAATIDMSPFTAEDKADLTKWLQEDITDGELLKQVLDTLDPILGTDPQKWGDEEDWSITINQAHQPAPDEIAGFLAHIACQEPEGHIALVMAERAEMAIDGALPYGASLVKALLNDTCEGAKALTKEKRARLEELGVKAATSPPYSQ
jgi:uncharacterized protein YjbI with pentapeptide repeats